MEVLMDRRRCSLQSPFASGGEADIYRVDTTLAAKIYHAYVISSDRRLKVLALCNSYANNVQQFGTQAFAFPRVPAYADREELDLLCGFGMTYFSNRSEVNELGYDLTAGSFKGPGRLSDDSAVEFIYGAFELLALLHKARIILGDVNPRNVLVNWDTKTPLLVDLDSAQVGQFKCPGYSPEYIDPLLQLQGRNASGGYTYNMEADVFSMACVLCEFMVGAHPYSVRIAAVGGRAPDIETKKLNHASYLHLLNGTGFAKGVTHVDAAIDRDILGRLKQIGNKWPKLLEFFKSTFVENQRMNLVETLDRSDPRHPAFVFYSSSGFGRVLQHLVLQKGAVAAVAATAGGSRLQMPDSGFSHVVGITSSQVVSAASPQTAVSPSMRMPDSGFLDLFTEVGARRKGAASPQLRLRTDPPGLLTFAAQYKVDLSSYL